MPKKKALVAASRKQFHIIWSVWHNNKPFELPEKFWKQEQTDEREYTKRIWMSGSYGSATLNLVKETYYRALNP